jgi:hypothetical protein
MKYPIVLRWGFPGSDKKKGSQTGHPQERKRGTSPHTGQTATTKQGRERPTTEKERTEAGTETHHHEPQARTEQNGNPNREEANPANESAAAEDPNHTTTTHRENDRAEGRTPTNEPPDATANEATTPGTGAGQPNGERETEKTATGQNPQRHNAHSHTPFFFLSS